LFSTDQSVGNNDFVGLGTSSSSYIRNTIVIPSPGQLQEVVFSIRGTSPGSYTGTVYISTPPYTNNEVATTLAAYILDGNVQDCATGISSVAVNVCDLISFRFQRTGGGALAGGICAVIRFKSNI